LRGARQVIVTQQDVSEHLPGNGELTSCTHVVFGHRLEEPDPLSMLED